MKRFLRRRLRSVAYCALGSRTAAADRLFHCGGRDEIKPATWWAQKKRAKERNVKSGGQDGNTRSGCVMKRRGRIERVNAQSKNRGLGSMLVRSLKKVQAVALLHALAHNIATVLRLRAAGGANLLAASRQ